MIVVDLTVTTETGGTGSATDTHKRLGALYAVKLIDGTFSDGVDATITCENETLTIPHLVKADFNADGMYYPRVAENLNTDGSALATYCMPVVDGACKLAIAQGGSVTTGGCRLYILEL